MLHQGFHFSPGCTVKSQESRTNVKNAVKKFPLRGAADASQASKLGGRDGQIPDSRCSSSQSLCYTALQVPASGYGSVYTAHWVGAVAMSSSRYDVYGAALTDVYFDAASYTGRLASSKPLDAELVAHIGTASERCPSPSYVPPGSPPHADPGLRLRDMVGPEGESVLRYHESNEPVRGGLLERSEGARRTVWIGSLERTVASEHAVRAVMRQAGHVACVHLVKQPERSQKKSWALVVFREMAAAEMAASTDSGPLPGAQNWRVAMVKPERVPGKQLTIALEGWRENKNSSHARRQSLGQVESADYQTQRIGLVTAPVPASPRPGAVGLSSPSRALVQDMTRHPGGAVGSRGSMGFAETNEFATPSKQRPSFANSGSPRGFFGIATPGSVHNTPRGLSIGSRFGAQLDQDGGTADANASTTRAMLVAGDEAEFEPLTEAEPKQLISYARLPPCALHPAAARRLLPSQNGCSPSGLLIFLPVSQVPPAGASSLPARIPGAQPPASPPAARAPAGKLKQSLAESQAAEEATEGPRCRY